jgi:predicted porin
METAFSPLSGELDDGPGSLARNNSIPRIQNWTATSDSSRAGQALNGPVYGGMSHPTYGTLTIGRQQSLLLDAIGVYDPQSQAYAFSLIGWTAFFAGAGDSETARWDNSVKYIYEYGPFHAAGMYTQGGEDTGMFAGGYAFDIGGSYQGFSIDAIYTKERSAVSGATLSSCAVAAAIGFDCQRSLAGTISDNSAWSVQAKYSFEIGAGGFKDETPASKLTFYAGYENIIQGNPEDIVNAGERTMGGYILATVNNSNFFTSRLNQVAWTGIKYEFLAGWRITGAYYYQDQNSFRTGVAGNTCFQQTAINTRNKAAGTFQGNPVAANCNGDVYSTSLVVDYQINKYFDVYGGVQYSDVSGGLSSGFLQDNQASVVTGTRLKF